MKILLHIGLHKTGSTALQNVFSENFVNGEVIYNPADIVSMIEYAIDNPSMKDDYIQKAKSSLQILSEKNNSKTVFISDENLSQRFCFQDYDYCAQIIQDVLPGAEIVIFLRFQSDWILSCYKQSIQLGDPQSIIDYLNYSNGEFGNNDRRFGSNGLLNLNIHKSDWTHLLDVYTKMFGRENIHVYFYENLKNDFKSVVDDIGNILGVKLVYNKRKRFRNRSYSGLACKMTIYKYHIYRYLGLKRFLPLSTKYNIEELLLNPPVLINPDHANLSNKVLSWEEAKRNLSFTSLAPVFFKKIFQRLKDLSWRSVWQLYFDRLIYIDWDLLAKKDIRNRLNIITREKNKSLLKYFSEDEIPKKYLYGPK